MSSNAASMTRSASGQRALRRGSSSSRPHALGLHVGLQSDPFRHRGHRFWRLRHGSVPAPPVWRRSSVTWKPPAFKKFTAMPAPMVPAPITPTLVTGRSSRSRGLPGIRATSRSPKNKCRSARDCGVALLSPSEISRPRRMPLAVTGSVTAASIASIDPRPAPGNHALTFADGSMARAAAKKSVGSAAASIDRHVRACGGLSLLSAGKTCVARQSRPPVRSPAGNFVDSAHFQRLSAAGICRPLVIAAHRRRRTD